MPYLVDGHNLVPSAGLRLQSVDDELELIRLLQEFSRKSRKRVEVYFDGAPVGRAGTRKFGQVVAHFVSERSSADAAIMSRLRALGAEARNWSVVSSDAAVVAAARKAHAETESSTSFGRRLQEATSAAKERSNGAPRDGGISDEEMRHWLNVFNKR